LTNETKKITGFEEKTKRNGTKKTRKNQKRNKKIKGQETKQKKPFSNPDKNSKIHVF
jgi:hypothetical protein